MAVLTALAALAAASVLPATTAGVVGLGAVTAGASILEKKFKKSKQVSGVTPAISDPTAVPETGGNPLDALRRRRRTSGRADTIRAGSLIPEDVGTKSLLG